MKGLNTTLSTLHNIIKRFRESEEISLQKGEGWKSVLDACEHRALRRHRIKEQAWMWHRNNIFTNHFLVTQVSVPSINASLLHSNINHIWFKKKKATIFSSKRVWSKVENCSVGTMNWNSIYNLKNTDPVTSKEQRDHSPCYQTVPKPTALMDTNWYPVMY